HQRSHEGQRKDPGHCDKRSVRVMRRTHITSRCSCRDTHRMSAPPHGSGLEPSELPADARLWLVGRRAGLPTPGGGHGIRFLEGSARPQLLEVDHTEEDRAHPGISPSVTATADTNARISWAADGDGERAYGYWSGARDDSAPVAVLVALDSEGQYTM